MNKHQRDARARHLWREVQPQVLPVGWRRVEQWSCDGAQGARYEALGRMAVIATAEVHEDGLEWLHVSASLPARIPNWRELCAVKRVFFGPEREAFHFIPREDQYVNVAETTMHLWCPLSVPGLDGLIGRLQGAQR